MMTLESLPNELLDNILDNLNNRDQSSLSRTSHRMRRVAQPATYKAIVLTWENHPTATASGGPKPPLIQVLIRTLLEKPHYVEWVKSLEFKAVNCTYSDDEGETHTEFPSMMAENIQAEDLELLDQAIDRRRIPLRHDYKKRLRTKDSRSILPAFQILLTALCINLESLTVSIDFLTEQSWLLLLIDPRLRSMPALTPEDAPLCSRLSSVRIVTEPSMVHEWFPLYEDLRLLLKTLYYLPNMQAIEINSSINSNEYREPPEFTWTLQEPPVATKLTTLRLRNASVEPQLIKQLLLTATNLQHFEYDCHRHMYTMPLDLAALRDSLQPVRKTLLSLTFRYEYGAGQAPEGIGITVSGIITGSLGSLKDFTALKSLTTSLASLCGANTAEIIVLPHLVEMLPASLQHLTITDDLWTFRDFLHYKDLGALEMFKEFFAGEVLENRPPEEEVEIAMLDAGGASLDTSYHSVQGQVPLGFSDAQWLRVQEPGWRAATPDLESFEYDVRRHGHMSAGYWNEQPCRETLEAMCDVQGVFCEVLWDERACAMEKVKRGDM